MTGLAIRGRRRLTPKDVPAIGDRFQMEGGHWWTLTEKRGTKQVTAYTMRADNGAVVIVHNEPKRRAPP